MSRYRAVPHSRPYGYSRIPLATRRSPSNSVTEQRRIQSRRAWNEIESNFDELASAFPDSNTAERLSTDAADAAFRRAENLYYRAVAAALLGQDDLVQLCAFYIQNIAYSLSAAYVETLNNYWIGGMLEFNHGQLSIFLFHYVDAISAHQENAVEEWPEVDPEMYVGEVYFAYESEVWDRAFSDITEAPVPALQYLVNIAKSILEMAEDVSGMDAIPLPKAGKYIKNVNTGEWHRVTDNPNAPRMRGPTI